LLKTTPREVIEAVRKPMKELSEEEGITIERAYLFGS
jgi:hypothetical protein